MVINRGGRREQILQLVKIWPVASHEMRIATAFKKLPEVEAFGTTDVNARLWRFWLDDLPAGWASHSTLPRGLIHWRVS